jgi:MerR family mercuric resistance operon transcriptional regulator
MGTMTIGEVARLAKVSVETIRFYERRGLILEPPRNNSGYRQYSADAVSRLRFICRTKRLGFSLKEIKELLSLRLEPGTRCAEIQKRTQAKILDIREKQRSLQQMKQALDKLTAACSGRGTVSECPILAALEERNEERGKINRRF